MNVRWLTLCLSALASTGCRPGVAPPPGEGLAAPRVQASVAANVSALVDVVAAAERVGAGRAALVAQSLASEGDRLGAFVSVPDDECVLVVARGVASVGDLDLVLWSDEGEWLTGDERRDAEPTVFLCPPHPERVHAMALVAAGRGQVAMTAQRVPRQHEAALRQWLVALRPSTSRPDPQGRRVLVHANPDLPTLVPFELEAGTCAEVHAMGSGGTVDPDLVVLDARGVVRRRAVLEPGDGATLRACVREAFHGSLAVRSRLGQGDLLVGVEKGTRARWLREGRRIDELGLGRATLEGDLRRTSVQAEDAHCMVFEPPTDGACELARGAGEEVASLPAALCGHGGRAAELRCSDEARAPVVSDVRVDGVEILDEKQLNLVERGLAALGSVPVHVRVLRAHAGDPVRVTPAVVEGPGAPSLGAFVVVRESRRRFVARVVDRAGPVLHQAAGIGEVLLAMAPAGRDVVVEAAGLDEGEAFVVIAPAP